MAKVVIFTGAGLSAESGIDTFRDSGGIWEKHNIDDVCTKGCLDTNRDETIKFYDMLRTGLENKEPNHAHKVIAQLKQKYPDDISIITQNVDDLFEKAGCKDVIHVHGELKKIECISCNYQEDIGYVAQNEAWQSCPMCKKDLRPYVVFYNEPAPLYQDMFLELANCEFLVVIGTSGATLCVDLMLGKNIEYTILNNLEKSVSIDHKKFDKVLFKNATRAIDEIAKDIEIFLET